MQPRACGGASAVSHCGEHTARLLLIAKDDGNFIIARDNGTVSTIVSQSRERVVVRSVTISDYALCQNNKMKRVDGLNRGLLIDGAFCVNIGSVCTIPWRVLCNTLISRRYVVLTLPMTLPMTLPITHCSISRCKSGDNCPTSCRFSSSFTKPCNERHATPVREFIVDCTTHKRRVEDRNNIIRTMTDRPFNTRHDSCSLRRICNHINALFARANLENVSTT